MKTFKKLATLSMALLFTLGLGALAACEVEDTASSSPAASESAKAENCYNVTLNVWAKNESAKKFYESCGLTPQKIGMEKIL